MTQRFVEGGGRSAIVSGLPSGPMTYLTLVRWGSVIGTLTNSTDKHCVQGENYMARLKICLSGGHGPGKLCPDIANLLVTDETLPRGKYWVPRALPIGYYDSEGGD